VTRPGTGIVLAGGGARGAYQAGVLAVLAEHGVRPSALCGASIGALNAAAVAAAPDLATGSRRLLEVWRAVAEAGDVIGERPGGVAGRTARTLRALDSPVLEPEFVESLLARYAPAADLARGPQLWVSVASAGAAERRSRRPSADLLRAVLTRRGRWLRVQDLDEERRHAAVLASCALPLVLPTRQVNGSWYRDGSLFDNLPVGPLSGNPACGTAIVVHLAPGRVWDARRYADLGILEVRPRRPLAGPGPLGVVESLLDFSPATVDGLIAAGRADARAVLGPLAAALAARARRRDGAARVARALEALDAIDAVGPPEDPDGPNTPDDPDGRAPGPDGGRPRGSGS